MEWPKTDSDSSAKTEKMTPADYGSSASRITKSSSNPESVKTTSEVKYKEYENDKRMTEDFSTGPDNSSKTAGFDGAKTAQPQGEPSSSFIDTSHSKR